MCEISTHFKHVFVKIVKTKCFFHLLILKLDTPFDNGKTGFEIYEIVGPAIKKRTPSLSAFEMLIEVMWRRIIFIFNLFHQ